MANGIPGEGGGQRTYSEEDVMALMNEAARRAASEAVKNAQKTNEDEDDSAVSVINPKVVKQLKDTVAVFTALKDLSSNPLQKTIEETVGGMAASVVQSAFAPRSPPPKQDIVDKLLNSQFAYGLGSGLGQRAPELVETMGRTFGTDKAGQMMDNIIGKYGGGQSGSSRQLSPTHSGPSGASSSSGPSGPSSSNPSSVPEQKSDRQSEKELLLSLDPNNPEHVSAYAETQGGLPVDVARKMLMIHQDAFIEQLKRDGMNVDQISTQRGSRAQPGQPVQQPSPIQQAPPSPIRQDVHPMRPDVPPIYPDSSPNPRDQSSPQSSDDIEYTEYNDIMQPDKSTGPQPNLQSGHQPVPPGKVDDQQVEMMKTFATDIGKVMGEMLNKIETLNNTVFTLQSEMNDIKMNDIKKESPKQSPSVNREILTRPIEVPPKMPHETEYPPGMRIPISPITHIETPSLETFEDQIADTPKVGIDTETFEDQIVDTPKVGNIKRSEDFFEENVIDKGSFQQELEREAKLSNIQKQTSPSDLVQPVLQTTTPVVQPVPPIPVVQHVQPTIQQVVPTQPPVHAISQSPIVQQPIIQPEQFQSLATENMADINDSKEIPIIPDSRIDNKTSKDIDSNKFTTPIKKTGIHKKAEYRNIKPSFKKNVDENN